MAATAMPAKRQASTKSVSRFRFASGYWKESRRPLTSLLFVTPLLAVYEFGVWTMGPSTMRNGADVWLRSLLDATGVGGYFLLPALIVASLLAWHHTTHDKWGVSAGALYGMFAECCLLAIGLIAAANVIGGLFHVSGEAAAGLSLGVRIASLAGQLVTYCGAGIYEEVLFRLLLLPALYFVVKYCGFTPRTSWASAIAASSLLFAGAHYIGQYGEAFAWSSFTFRALAGGFFGVLFVMRGFGIAVGTHALYDIFVGVR